jgi:DNA-binding NarL/FixJ family response regulator
MTTVVVVDDHAMVRQGVHALLETNEDIQVVGDAADGLRAVELATELQPAVVVMDISLPGLSGIDAARAIRASCPDTQVLMLSLHDTADYLHQALRAGARGYVLKEAAVTELVPAIRAVVAGQRYLCQAMADLLIDYSR